MSDNTAEEILEEVMEAGKRTGILYDVLYLLQDLIVTSIITLGIMPLLEYAYKNNYIFSLPEFAKKFNAPWMDLAHENNKNKNKTQAEKDEEEERKQAVEFSSTIWSGLAVGVSRAGLLHAFLRCSQVLVDLSTPWTDENSSESGTTRLLFQRSFARQFSMVVGIALALGQMKRLLISRFVMNKDPRQLGLLQLFDKLMDFVLFAITGAFVVDKFDFDLGVGVQSVVTASGFSAVFLSFASRGFAEQLVGGLVLNVWDVFDEGDKVRFKDGTEGSVVRIGLVDTTIRQWDNLLISIPNAKLFDQPCYNLSKVKQSRVFQTLRFQYKDLHSLPDILESIKNEIKNCEGCNTKLILDGTKPFRLIITDYKPDHIEAALNCHFNIPPGTEGYQLARQAVLLAIARAMKEHNTTFALPAMQYVGEPKPE